MARKRHTAEEIVTKLRQVDALVSQPSDRGSGSDDRSLTDSFLQREASFAVHHLASGAPG